jgi:hypothetical protein
LSEKETEQREEQAGDFEPENGSSVNEGSPDGFAKSFCSGFRSGDCGLYSGDGGLAVLGVCGSILPDGLRGLGGAVAQHSRRDTHAYAQLSPDTVWFHKKSLRHFRWRCVSGDACWFELQASGIRSKVKKYPHARGRAAERKRG